MFLHALNSWNARPRATDRARAMGFGMNVAPSKVRNHRATCGHRHRLDALERSRFHTAQRLFDHFIGGGQQRIGNCKSKRIRGSEIKYQFKPARLLHRQFVGFGALQYLVNVGGGIPKQG
jgi:hypothetical protein